MSHWLDKVLNLLQTDTADLRELARLAGGNPATFYRGINLDKLDLTNQDIKGMEFGGIDGPYEIFVDGGTGALIDLDRMIQSIRRVSNQEERVALIVKLILDNREAALQIVERYGVDKAKYANAVLSQLERMMRFQEKRDTLFDRWEVRFFRDQDLARAAWRPFSRGMPSNRALLLLFMAKHLARYPTVNDFLQERIRNSYSIYLTPHLEKIYEYLGRRE